MLILPLNAFPWVLNGTLEAKVSLDRIQRFLTLQDQDLSVYYSQGKCLMSHTRAHFYLFDLFFMYPSFSLHRTFGVLCVIILNNLTVNSTLAAL